VAILDYVARLNNCYKRSFVIIYADDILLMALTVSSLESLLTACEKELTFLDMSINVKNRLVFVLVIVVMLLVLVL